MQNKKNIDLSILEIYDQEIKDYIKNHGSGVTMEELIPLLDEKSNIGHTHTQSEIGLDQVENKSSETIRNEITKENITTIVAHLSRQKFDIFIMN